VSAGSAGNAGQACSGAGQDPAVPQFSAGTLDEPTGLRTVANIFVDSKGDYYEIVDELPRFGASHRTTPEGPRDG
jgi:hypothetical protein